MIIKKIALLGVMAVLWLFFKVHGQSQPIDIKPLNIGDTIPQAIWNMPLQVVNHSEGKKTITLNDYKGKLIILDFWATWCSPCLVTLKKIDAYNEEFFGQSIILPVSNQPSNTIRPFLENNNWKFISFTDDTSFSKLFPHNTIPHVVWIKDKKVISITGSDEVTAKNIHEIIQDKKVMFYEKKDKLAFNYSLPLLVDNNGGGREYLLYHSVFTPFIDGLATQASKRETDGKLTKLCFTNFPVLNLFQEAYSHQDPLFNFPNRVILEIPDTLKYKITPPTNSEIGLWRRNNTYSYEIIVPKKMAEDIYSIFRQNIDQFFASLLGIRFKIEKREMSCLVLEELSPSQNHKAEAIKSRGHEPPLFFALSPSLQQLLMKLATINRNATPVVVFNGGLKGIEIEVPTDMELKDIDQLNQKLASYGLQIVKKIQSIEMLVIKRNEII